MRIISNHVFTLDLPQELAADQGLLQGFRLNAKIYAQDCDIKWQSPLQKEEKYLSQIYTAYIERTDRRLFITKFQSRYLHDCKVTSHTDGQLLA